VALIAFDDAPSRLRGLIAPALKQGASVVLVTDFGSDSYPDAVEVQPLSVLDEVLTWADYGAFDVIRENLLELRECLGRMRQAWVGKDAQVIICTPIPCGGIADCGVCSVMLKSGPQMACQDGPVFELKEI
jgi:dihydroorotate dehydrogenase electron transfer subunit